MEHRSSLGQWLAERCEREHLSLRGAAARTGVSHATIGDIIKGVRPLPENIKKLAQAFGGDGPNQRFALEDYLLTLAGYRSERPQEELSEPMAELMDKANQLNDPQLNMMICFAGFLIETETRIKHEATP